MKCTAFNVKLAGMAIGIRCPSSQTREFFADYLTEEPCSISVSVTRADVDAEAAADVSCKAGGHHKGAQLYELSAIQRKIAEVFPLHGRFLMHGAAITYQDGAYLFCAPSGGGKSTHISLWKRYLGSEVDIINGDKPFLSLEGDADRQYVWVHGSPWAGKELWQKNRSAPLRAICFVSKDSENSIARLSPGGCLPQLMRQVYLPRGFEAAGETLGLIDRVVGIVPLYELRCSICEDAVRCSFEAMTGRAYP